jgi:hypothetical protein
MESILPCEIFESLADGSQLVQLGSCGEMGGSQRGCEAANTEVEE